MRAEKQKFRRLSKAMWAFVGLLAFAVSGAWAQVPTASSPLLPGSQLVGDSLSSPVCLSNAGTATGYQPVYRIIAPGNVTVSGATFPVGGTLSLASELVGTGAATVTDPITGSLITLAAGERLYIVRLPIGSDSPGQAAMCMQLNYALPTTAPLGTPINLSVTPIFSLGADALDNPDTDPPIVGTALALPVTPTVWQLTKLQTRTEKEVPTGPDFPASFTLTANIAAGATISNIVISDPLPAQMQFLSYSVVGATCTPTASNTVTTTAPGGTLSLSCGSATGGTSLSDIVVTVNYYVPKCSSGASTSSGTCTGTTVLNPTSGTAVPITNTASASGSYLGQPLPAITGTDTITAKSQTVRKTSAVTTDAGPTGLSPGDTVTYTVSGAISDYFQFSSLVLTDLIGDGQTLVAGSERLGFTNNSVSGAAQTSALAPLSAANVTEGSKNATTGVTTLTVRLSDEAASRGLDPIFRGPRSLGATTGAQPATYTITYQTTVDRSYTATQNGTPALSAGDTVTNNVSTVGTNVVNGTPSGTVTDSSSASLTIAGGAATKSIAAINGVAPVAGQRLKSGDTVTYSVIETLPVATFEKLTITDSLPLPILKATEISATPSVAPPGLCAAGSPPPAGKWCLGPATTIVSPSYPASCYSPIAVTINTTANAAEWAFPDCEPNPVPPTSGVVELLFTVTIGAEPVADGLNLTNIAAVSIRSSSKESISVTGLAQIYLNEPQLRLKKTIAQSSNSTSTCPTSTAAYSNGVTTCSMADAGDLITYRLQVVNNGHSAAYDVKLTDDLGAGAYTSCSIVSVTDGSGNALAYTGALTAAQPLVLTGALAGTPSGGMAGAAQTLWIDYRCAIPVTQNPRTNNRIDNIARIKNYSTQAGGPNFATNTLLTGPNAGTATVNLIGIRSIVKDLAWTSVAGSTPNANLNPGEQAQFRITVSLSEGTYTNFTLTDSISTIPTLASCTTGANVTPSASGATATASACAISSNLTVSGTTLTCAATTGSTPCTIVLLTVPQAFNAAATNTATVGANNQTTQTSQQSVTVAPPKPFVSKNFQPTSGDAGDTVKVNLTWSNSDLDNPMFGCSVRDNLTGSGASPVTPSPAAGLFDASTLVFVAPASTTGYTCTGYNTQILSCVSATPTTLSSYGCTITAGVVTCQATDTTVPCASAATYATVQGTLATGLTTGTTYTNTVGLTVNDLPSTQSGGGGKLSASGTATFSATAPKAAAKRLVGTSLADTTGSNLAIGEVATFELDFSFSDGVTPSATIVDALTSGLLSNLRCVSAAQSATGSFCGAQLKRSDLQATTANDPGGINSTAVGTYVNVAVTENTGAKTVSLALGDVTRSAGASTGTTTFTLRLELQVQNTAANQAASAFTDRAQLTYVNGSGATVTVTGPTQTVRVVEPQVAVSKTVTPSAVQGGSVVTYSLVVQNTGTGAASYDNVVCDILPAQLTNFGTPTFTVNTPVGAAPVAATAFAIATGTCGSGSGYGLRGVIDQLDPTESVTITFTATVDPATPIGATVANTVSVNGSSLPAGLEGATVGTNGQGTSNERTGADNDSNFTASASANLTTQAISIAKSVTAPQTAYAVGDVVRYRLQVGLPVGTTSSLKVLDTLPAGLLYLGNPVYTIPATVSASNNPPTLTTQLSAPQLSWDFGSTTVSTAADVYIDFDAVVDNVLSNQRGVTLTNHAVVAYTNPAGGLYNVTAAAPPAIQIGEPNLKITKAITTSTANLQAGSTVGYQVDIAADNNLNNTPAYRTIIGDNLPALMINPSGFALTMTGSGPAACPSGACLHGTATAVSAADIVAVAGASSSPGPAASGSWSIPNGGTGIDLYPGVKLTVTFDALVDPVAPTTSAIGSNTAAASFASQSAAAASPQRDGSTAGSVESDDSKLNNYNTSTTSPGFTLASKVEISKALIAPASGSATIGQTATYKLRVSVSEGTTQNVTVTDVLPPDLIYLAHRSGWSAGCTAAGNPANGGSGQTVTLAYGNIVCPADGDLANNYLDIEIDARVANVVANQQGRTLVNGGSSTTNTAAGTNAYVMSGPTGSSRVDVDTDSNLAGLQGASLTIVEPQLTLTKTAVPSTQSPNDLVQFSLTLQHAAGCTVDAYNLVLTDTLPATLSYVSSSPAMSGSGPYTLQIPSLACGATQTVTLIARINAGAPQPSTQTNGATLTWKGLDGANGAADSGRTGQDGSGGLNDYVVGATGAVNVVDQHFLAATKTVAIVPATDLVNPGILDAGEQIEYTIVVQNFDPALTTTNTVFSDAIPANTTFIPGSITSVDADNNPYGAASFAGNTVTVAIGSMAPSSSVLASRQVTIRFRVQINAGVPNGTLIRNQGAVDSDQTTPEPTDADGNASNGDQPTDIYVGGLPPTGLSLYSTKLVGQLIDADGSGSNTVGDTMRYQLVLQNTGSSGLTSVVLDDVWPAGLGYVANSAAPAAQMVVTPASRHLVWTVPTLAAGATVTGYFDVTIDSLSAVTPAGTYVNQATVSGQTSGGQTVNTQTDGNGIVGDGNQPTVFTAGPTGSSGTPVVDLQKRVILLVDSDGSGAVSPGDVLQYSLLLSNSGSGSATNVRVSDVVPSQLTLVVGTSATSKGVIDTETSTGLTVNVGQLSQAEIVTISFQATVKAGTIGQTAVNQASASGDNITTVLSDDNGNAADGRNPNQTPIYGSASSSWPLISKALLSSSEAGSSGTNVLIGEVLTYAVTVTVPHGTTANLSLLDTLPVGLSYVAGSATLTAQFNTALHSALDPGGINALPAGTTVTLPGSAVVLGSTAGGNTTLRLALGDVIDSDSDTGPPETYTLTYKAVVQNIAANVAGTKLINTASASFNNAVSQLVTLSPTSVTANVLEPTLTLVKSANVGTMLASGGTVRFTLTVGNPAAAGNVGPAYNVAVKDVLPAEFTSYSVVSVTAGGGVSGVNAVGSGTTIEYTVDSFPADGTLSIVVDAVAAGPLSNGSTVTNTANLSWTSLPGANGSANATPGAAGSSTGERTGAGGGTPNTYTATSSAAIKVGTPSVIKSVVAPRPQYAVGDLVSYALTLSYPSGELDGNKVVDTLPAGLLYVPGSLQVIVQPNLTLTPATVSVAVAGNVVTFTLGQVRNPDATVRTVQLTYQARVADVLGNQSGETLANSAVLSYTDPTSGATQSAAAVSQSVRVGEPFIALTKTVVSAPNPLIAGSVIRYKVTASNSGTTPAYSQVISDTLPATLANLANISITPSYAAASALYGASSAPTIPVANQSAGGWSTTPFQLNPGDSVEIDFDATVQNSVIPGHSIANSVTTTFSSLPANDPNLAYARDGSTPGSTQTDGNLNNYNASANVAVTAGTDISLAKTLASTSGATGSTDRYAVGETITYRLRLSMAPGTYNAVQVADTLPAGLTYQSFTLTLGNGGITPANAAAITLMVSGQDLLFNLGTVVDPARTPADPATDYLDLNVTAQVDNVLSNQEAVSLVNGARLTHQPATGGPVTGVVRSAAVTVAEPVLALSKSADVAISSLGDQVTYTLRVEHTAASTANAYNVVITDTLPAGMSYVAGSASLTPDAVSTAQQLQWTVPSIALSSPGYTEISYRAQVATNAAIGQPLVNQAALTYQSAPSGSVRTGADGSTGALNNYATAATATVTPAPLRTINASKTVALANDADSSNSVTPGDTLEYVVVLTNTASTNQTNVVFTDAVPVFTSYVTGSLTTSQGTVNDAGSPLVVNVGTMTPAQAVTVRFRVSVGSGAAPSTVIRNQGSVDSDQVVPTPTDDPTVPGTTDPTDIPVGGLTPTSRSDLAATKTVALSSDVVLPLGTINVGDSVTYTIALINTGATTLTNISLTDTVPASLQVTAVTGGSYAGNDVTATIASLGVGQSASIQIVALATSAGTFDNQGTVTANELSTPVLTDGDPASAGAQPTPVTVLPVGQAGSPALVVGKTQAIASDTNLDGLLNPGESLVYTITVRNSGSAPAQNVTLTDALPAPLAVQSVAASQGVVVSNSPVMTVNLGTLAVGAIATVIVNAAVPSNTALGTTLVNTAYAQADGIASTPSPTVTIVVQAPVNLAPPIGIKNGVDLTLPRLRWTQTWINANNAVPLLIQMSDPLPASQTYEAGTLVCTPNGSTVIASCVYDAVLRQVKVVATLGPDLGHVTAATAVNALTVTFVVKVLQPGRYTNTASAQWDANGNGNVADDIYFGQTPTTATATLMMSPVNIPTLSSGALALLSLLMALAVMRRRGGTSGVGR